jgi:isoleucyl-tRNA synthetase
MKQKEKHEEKILASQKSKIFGDHQNSNEERILRFWKKNKTYKKSVKRNSKGKLFYMMDGPPYATGYIHMGTALNKIIKDIAMRSHRLQGFNVFDRAGYDTHGVPIEFQIEKEIGSKSKKDIEKYGIKRFVEKCKQFATKFIDVMNDEFENLGVWMDFKNPYLTLNDDYVETIWDCFKIADKKGLLYLGKYPVHICPRCETAVAYNEVEYKKQEDTSVFVKFPLKTQKDNVFLIIWTTTPWTLPGNTGIMVNPNFDYQEVKVEGETWIIAKKLVEKIMKNLGKKYELGKTIKGKDMDGWKYENPLSKNLKLNVKNGYRIVLSSRYVNLEEGTGLVHCAPGHGKEDYEVGKKHKLDAPCPVDISGLLTEETGKYANKKARIVDREIIEDLEKDNRLVHKLKYSHDYPLCWRCKSSLLMVSMPQWFLKISKIHSKLLKENMKTNWIPDYMELRMKAWLKGISDWPVSRKRYWGTPLPIWICDDCNKRVVVGSIKELKELGGKVHGVHKPEIDNVKLKCKCGGKMNRVEEVLDVWFDSGVSSWAALGKQKMKFWPANVNIEGKDQVRGWWNSQLILSQIKFNKKPFENILVHGMVLDLSKRKMSKSKGNITSPQEIIDKYSRDYLRYYFAKISKGEDFAFDEKEFKEIKKTFIILNNVNNFISQLSKEKTKIELKTEDKWILSKYGSLVKDTTESYNKFKFSEVVQLIEEFLVFDLSRTYIQIIRDRADETYEILNKIRIGLLKLLAPITPFITEKIWQDFKKNKLVKEESVHLSDWPKINEKLINKNLENQFDIVLDIIEKGLAERDKAKIGLKWPLNKAIVSVNKQFNNQLKDIIKNQLNIKEIEIRNIKANQINVKLDTKTTPELEAEGYAREISRKVQSARKKVGLIKVDKIKLGLVLNQELKELLSAYPKILLLIKERTNSEEVMINPEKKDYKHKSENKIKDKNIRILFSKL